MSFNEETFSNLKIIPESLLAHFHNIKKQMNYSMAKNLKEIEILQKFITNLNKLGLGFERNLFKASQEFQNDMKNNIKDEKLCEVYQLIINSLLKYADNIQITFKGLLSHIRMLQSSEYNFKNVVDNVKTNLKTNISSLSESLDDYSKNYEKYILTYSNHLSQRKDSQDSSIIEISKLEQVCLDKHDKLETMLMYNSTHIFQKLKETGDIEKEIKRKIKNASLNIIGALTPSRLEEIKEKVEKEDNFRIYFKDLTKEMGLNFSKLINIDSFSFRFCDFSTFHRLDNLYDSPYTRFLFEKIKENEKGINPKIRFYIELLCEKLYRFNVEFDQEVIDEIHFIIVNDQLCNYFIYNIIHKKTVVLLEKPFGNLEMTKTQIKNMMQIAQYYFLICANKDRVDYEAVYHFMKFTLTIFTDHKDCLLELLNKTIILNDCNFWYSLMIFFSSYFKPSKKIKNEIISPATNNNLFIGIKNIVSTLTQAPNSIKSHQYEKAFEEVSFLIFKSNLDFEAITDILMFLAPKANISLENVKNLLQRNQDLFLAQITQSKEYYIEYKKYNNSDKLINKTQKLYYVLKRVLPYLHSIEEMVSLTQLNRFFKTKREKIFSTILYTIKLTNGHLRKELILHQARLFEGKDYLKRDIPKREIDPTIMLDVKRTCCDNPSFDHEGLKLILANICSPKMGNFPYYQGLNYIVCYFMLLFKDDQILTYNFATNLLYTHFSQYIDKELKNLRKLFFYLKRLIKIYLPVLSNFLENEQKLDTDIVFASWCLTLFTTITQYFDKYELLDEVMDIFLAKGWPGFFQVVLVIFDDLQEVIFKQKYEEILIILTDLPKTGFERLLKEHNRQHISKPKKFSFKDKIKKFKHVNKAQIAFFSGEYHNILERVEEFWFRLSRKIKHKRKK